MYSDTFTFAFAPFFNNNKEKPKEKKWKDKLMSRITNKTWSSRRLIDIWLCGRLQFNKKNHIDDSLCKSGNTIHIVHHIALSLFLDPFGPHKNTRQHIFMMLYCRHQTKWMFRWNTHFALPLFGYQPRLNRSASYRRKKKRYNFANSWYWRRLFTQSKIYPFASLGLDLSGSARSSPIQSNGKKFEPKRKGTKAPQNVK